VRHLGLNSSIWADHTDIRPTILSLLGLTDDYAHDGRVLTEALDASALPASLAKDLSLFQRLAGVYKQLDACVGQFGLDTLKISTAALKSDASGDGTYTQLENSLTSFGQRRDALAAQMSAMLEGAAFHGQPLDKTATNKVMAKGRALLSQVHDLAGTV
jgi:hypothetical protein